MLYLSICIYIYLYLSISINPIYQSYLSISGYASQSHCSMDETHPYSYQLIKQNLCAHVEDSDEKMSYKLTNCEIGMDGPQITFELYRGHKCKASGAKHSGLIYSYSVNWREFFNVTTPSSSSSCSMDMGWEEIPASKYFKFGCVNNNMLTLR